MYPVRGISNLISSMSSRSGGLTVPSTPLSQGVLPSFHALSQPLLSSSARSARSLKMSSFGPG